MSGKTVEELETEIKELKRQLAENYAHGESLMGDYRRKIRELTEEIRQLKNELDQCRKQSKKP
jgi:ribosomal protein L29